jgi:hypothetical protein
MIKANELRIGNYVALTKEAKEDFQNIIGEKTNDCYDITFFNPDGVDFDGYDFTFNELKPIPLTEDWLLKLPKDLVYPDWIEFVHDLQNWYYWNNNKKELIISI